MEQEYSEAVNPEAVTIEDCLEMKRKKGCITDIGDGQVRGFPEDRPLEKKDMKRYPVYALIVRRGKDRIQWSTRRKECLRRKRADAREKERADTGNEGPVPAGA